MAVDDDYDDNYINEDASANGDKMSGGTAWEVLTKVELDVAYSSEKALNLDMLLMQVEDRASDYEAPTLENEDLSTESVGKAFEFNILSGIMNSEVEELDSFLASLQVTIADARRKFYESDHCEEFLSEIKEKLHDAEESVKKTHDAVADIRMRLTKFESNLAFYGFETRNGADVEIEVGQRPPANAKLKQHNDQQRHFLQMLEKSLARELDFEKKLSESRHNEEELKLKLLYAEQETDGLEESMEMILQRTFEAENAVEILFGISKELTGKLQVVQFNLKGSVLRECEVRSRLEECMKKLSAAENDVQKLKTSFAEVDGFPVLEASDLKDNLEKAEDECNPAISEALSLREKVRALEEQLRESDTQLQLAKASTETSQEQENTLHGELRKMENVIEGLKEDASRLESRAESAEEKCTLLTKTNLELNEQLGFLRNNGTEKAISLERKLEESDMQLEHAKASVEAIEEQQNMLYSALGDMENLIEDLKGKVSKAESRAESAESKCTLLTETNLELNEELGFLRSRLECVEASLNQADDAKIATAKDIGIRTKFITDLVTKLALERERLQLQISLLTKQNKILAKKCLKTKDSAPSNTSQKEIDTEDSILKSPEEALTRSATTNIQVDKSVAAVPDSATSMDQTTVSTEDSLDAVSKIETVRTIEATQLNLKYLITAVLVFLVSVLAIYLFQLEK